MQICMLCLKKKSKYLYTVFQTFLSYASNINQPKCCHQSIKEITVGIKWLQTDKWSKNEDILATFCKNGSSLLHVQHTTCDKMVCCMTMNFIYIKKKDGELWFPGLILKTFVGFV
jgi:hypothetical protein